MKLIFQRPFISMNYTAPRFGTVKVDLTQDETDQITLLDALMEDAIQQLALTFKEEAFEKTAVRTCQDLGWRKLVEWLQLYNLAETAIPNSLDSRESRYALLRQLEERRWITLKTPTHQNSSRPSVFIAEAGIIHYIGRHGLAPLVPN